MQPIINVHPACYPFKRARSWDDDKESLTTRNIGALKIADDRIAFALKLRAVTQENQPRPLMSLPIDVINCIFQQISSQDMLFFSSICQQARIYFKGEKLIRTFFSVLDQEGDSLIKKLKAIESLGGQLKHATLTLLHCNQLYGSNEYDMLIKYGHVFDKIIIKNSDLHTFTLWFMGLPDSVEIITEDKYLGPVFDLPFDCRGLLRKRYQTLRRESPARYRLKLYTLKIKLNKKPIREFNYLFELFLGNFLKNKLYDFRDDLFDNIKAKFLMDQDLQNIYLSSLSKRRHTPFYRTNLGRFKKSNFYSLGEFNLALISDPRCAYALQQRGALKLRMKKYHNAIEDLKRADELYPEDPFTLRKIGKCYHAIGQWEEAISFIARAIFNDRTDPKGYASLAKIFFSLQRYRLALKNINRALILSPENGKYLSLSEKIITI